MRFGLFIMGTRSSGCRDILDQVNHAEALGFDTVVLAERHFQHGDLLYPSPFSMAAAIAARTERIRIGLAARILPLHHPLRVAEEAATLDILSGGRLEFGATRASLDERCHQVFCSPAADSRGRFQEALDIIVQAWTRERVSFAGTYYQIADVSGLPRPVQEPHPPIQIVAVSPETTAYVGRRGYSPILPAIHSLTNLQEAARVYWRNYHGAGHNGRADRLAVNRFIYVADSDARALREMRTAFLTFVAERAPDLNAALRHKYGAAIDDCFDEFVHDFCLFGAPETVSRRIAELEQGVGVGYLLCSLNFITLDHEACLRSMELFAEEVMPRFQHSTVEHHNHVALANGR